MRKVRICLWVVMIFIAAMAVGGVNNVKAADYDISDSHYDENGQKIYDYAKLLDDEEKEVINEKIIDTAKETKLELIVLTVEGNGGKTPAQYAADFYDEHGFGYDRECGSGVILYVDMENRDIYISTAGIAMVYITDDEAEDIYETIAPYMTRGDYADGVLRFISEVRSEAVDGFEDSDYADAIDAWYSDGIKNSDNMEDFYDEYVYKEDTIFTYLKNPLISGIIALVVAGVAVLIMNSSAKTPVTVSGRTYMKGNTFKLNTRTDFFTHTTTTKRKIETDNGGSGGGSSRTISSSGHSHGGGGGKF